MQRILCALALMCALALASPAQTKTAPKSKIVFRAAATTGTTPVGIQYTWTPGVNAAPTCPLNGTLANCILGQQLTITRPDTSVLVIPAGSSAGTISPSAVSYLWQPGGSLPYGTYKASLVAVGYNDAGAEIMSTAATATTLNGLTSLNPPTGLVGTAQ
jgi:hypothetical protein